MKKRADSRGGYTGERADGPVAWNEWGADAANRAAERGLPLCVCVANAASRWSYEMKSLFSHPEVASLLNGDYVPVLCDADETPNVTLAARAMARMTLGHAGWPLFLFLTPRREPIFAASYMPLHSDDPANPGFLDVLRRIKWLWLMKKTQLDEAAAIYAVRLGEAVSPFAAPLVPGLSSRAVSRLKTDADTLRGGWGAAPKFPRAAKLLLAEKLCQSADGRELFEHTLLTLRALVGGSLRDAIAGGFHDYCLDAAWRAPILGIHTARNAALLASLLEGWRLTGDAALLAAFDSAADYLLSAFARDDGLICPGDDARDSRALWNFYLWSRGELEAALGPSDTEEFFGAADGEDYIDPVTGTPTGKKLLRADPFGSGFPPAETAAKLEAARQKRGRPALDDRALARDNAWLAALAARAARLTGRGERLETAERLVALIERTFVKDGGLAHSVRGSACAPDATLEDVSALTWAYIELYRAGGGDGRLDRARAWACRCDEDFGREGAWNLACAASHRLLPAVDAGDDFLPSATAVMANNLVTLSALTGEPRWLSRARGVVGAYGGALNEYPDACAGLTLAALRAGRGE